MLLQNEYGDRLDSSLFLGVVDENDEVTEKAVISVLVEGDEIRIIVRRIEDDPTVVFTVI